MMKRWCPQFLGLLLIGSSLGVIAAEPQGPVPYPRINLAQQYVVDSSWPQRPENRPWGAMPSIAVDRQDQVWLFTRSDSPVQVYSPAGAFLREFPVKVVAAHSVRFDPQGRLWLVDVKNHTVEQWTTEGRRLRTLGTPGEPGDDQRHFNRPTDVVVTPRGDIYVTDGYGNARVVQFSPEGKFVRAWGTLGVKPGQFSLPHAIVADSQGRLYVADRNNVRIQVFSAEGKLLDVWQNLLVPWGLWISPSDEIWACGCSPMTWRDEDKCLSCPPNDQLVMRFSTAGKLLQLITFPKAADGQERPGELNWLHAIAIDSRGNLYLGDIIGKRAQKFVRKP